VYLRDKLGLVEMNSLLKKEVITPRLGGSIDMLLIYGQSFFIWKMVQVGKFLSSPESGLRFLTGKSFSSSENGPDRTVIFVMKMV
jgi:hypothetical protein